MRTRGNKSAGVPQNLSHHIAAAQPEYALPPKLERKLASRFIPQGMFLAWTWSRPWQSTVALVGAKACIAALVTFLPRVRNTNGMSGIAAGILDNHLRAAARSSVRRGELGSAHGQAVVFRPRRSLRPRFLTW